MAAIEEEYFGDERMVDGADEHDGEPSSWCLLETEATTEENELDYSPTKSSEKSVDVSVCSDDGDDDVPYVEEIAPEKSSHLKKKMRIASFLVVLAVFGFAAARSAFIAVEKQETVQVEVMPENWHEFIEKSLPEPLIAEKLESVVVEGYEKFVANGREKLSTIVSNTSTGKVFLSLGLGAAGLAVGVPYVPGLTDNLLVGIAAAVVPFFKRNTQQAQAAPDATPAPSDDFL